MNSNLNRISDWALLARKARYRALELARLNCVSLRQLERYFGDYFGRAPQDWLDELRLIKAGLLLTTGTPVKEVAWQVEFTNAAHFSRRFKKLFGCSPSEFVRIHDRRRAERKRQFEKWLPEQEVPESWLADPALTKPWDVLLQMPRRQSLEMRSGRLDPRCRY